MSNISAPFELSTYFLNLELLLANQQYTSVKAEEQKRVYRMKVCLLLYIYIYPSMKTTLGFWQNFLSNNLEMVQKKSSKDLSRD